MGRTRVIDRQAVLDAAERVVARVGAAHLTLDAVAIEAGISKASVIYDYKSKHALIKAVIERSVAKHSERLRAHIADQGAVAEPVMRGRIAAVAARSVSDMDRTVALNLVAALACDVELRALVEAAYREHMAEVVERSARPRQAMLAFLALEGMQLMERFGFYAWPQDERDALLGDIGGMLGDAMPAPEAALS